MGSHRSEGVLLRKFAALGVVEQTDTLANFFCGLDVSFLLVSSFYLM
jgi:hypothetical protein